MFPPVFCVSIPDGAADTVAVFSASQIRPRVYSVAPYRILHGSNGAAMPEEAYAMDGRFGGHPSHIHDEPLTLIAYHPEMGELVFEGSWTHCGTTVFSMYCGAAIPMLQFSRFVVDHPTAIHGREVYGLNSDWFRLSWDNHLPVVEGSRRDIRRWAQRWNPMTWIQRPTQLGPLGLVAPPLADVSPQAFREAGESGQEGGSARGGSPVPPVAAAPPARAQVASLPNGSSADWRQPLPKFVADLLIRDAVARNATCPITMEPIQVATATATPCFHVFNADALAAWSASGHSTCPECRSYIQTTAT